MRLASTSTDWEWIGEVHEYVQRKDGVWQDRNDVIQGYWLEHDASGGNDGKRFVRDETILSRVRGVPVRGGGDLRDTGGSMLEVVGVCVCVSGLGHVWRQRVVLEEVHPSMATLLCVFCRPPFFTHTHT